MQLYATGMPFLQLYSYLVQRKQVAYELYEEDKA